MTDTLATADARLCSCGVPTVLHNTCCGWANASIQMRPGERTFSAVLSAYEKWVRAKEAGFPVGPRPLPTRCTLIPRP